MRRLVIIRTVTNLFRRHPPSRVPGVVWFRSPLYGSRGFVAAERSKGRDRPPHRSHSKGTRGGLQKAKRNTEPSPPSSCVDSCALRHRRGYHDLLLEPLVPSSATDTSSLQTTRAAIARQRIRPIRSRCLSGCRGRRVRRWVWAGRYQSVRFLCQPLSPWQGGFVEL